MGLGSILAAGVEGWQRGTRFRQDQEESAADRAWRNEQRSRQRQEWSDADTLKRDLKAEAQPVQVVEGAGGAVLPASMDNRDVGLPGEQPVAMQGFRVGDKTFADRAGADSAAAAMNDPAAVAGRQAQVFTRAGMPDKAATLEARQAALTKTAEDLRERGVMGALKAFRAGDQKTAVAGLKKSGLFPMGDGDVTMVPKEIEVPGIGKLQTYDMTFPLKGEDGTVKPFTINSHTATMAMMPYEKQLELLRKGTDTDSKAGYREATLDLKAKQVETAGELAAARIARLQAGGGGGGGRASGDREYRLNLQNMMTNVTREAREVDAKIKDIQGDPLAAKTRASELRDLQAQRSELSQRRSALNDEFVGLAEKKSGGGNENLAAQRAPKAPKMVETARGKLPQISKDDKAAYDRLPSGAKYIAPDGSQRTKK